MAIAAVRHQALRLIQCLVKICGPVHGQYGGELFVGKLFGKLHALHLADEDLGAFRHRDPGQLGNGIGALAYDFRVEGAVDEDGLTHLAQFILLEEVATPGGKFRLHLGVHAIHGDDGLLRGADHAVVKGFGMNDGIDGKEDIRAIIDDGGGIARANAQGGLAAGIG